MNSSDDLRLVSLLPSATEILACLELVDRIIGISHECDYPPEIQDRAICTAARLYSDQPSNKIHQQVDKLLQSAISIYQINLDLLEQLQPTHIITQDQCDVCAVSFSDVQKAVAQLPSQPQIISLQPNTLKDVWADIQRVGATLGVAWQPVIARLQKRASDVQTHCQRLPQRTVACIEWTEPLMLAANWIPEMVEMVRGQPIGGVTGQHSPRLSWDDLAAADPETIVFMPCGFSLDRTRQEVQPLTSHPQWAKLKAVQTGSVYITDGNAYFNRPGPRLVESLEILAEILHPTMRGSYGHQGSAWIQL